MATRVKRDDIDKFLDHGIDLSTRTIYIGGECEEIDSHEAQRVISALHILDRTDGEITIKICSPGGDWYCGMAIYDAVATCANEVKMVGYGQIMSMAAIILQAADTRILMPRASVMVHYGSEWFGGHTKDLQRRAEESRRSSETMEDIFLAKINEKHPEYTREQFKSKFAFDVFMSAEEAVEFGLADEIAN